MYRRRRSRNAARRTRIFTTSSRGDNKNEINKGAITDARDRRHYGTGIGTSASPSPHNFKFSDSVRADRLCTTIIVVINLPKSMQYYTKNVILFSIF